MTHTMGCLCAPDRADSAKPSVTYILSKSFVTNTLEALMHVADDGKFLPNEGILVDTQHFNLNTSIDV